MSAEEASIDISDLPELARIAEEVQTSKQPKVLRRGSEELAVLLPLEPQPSSKRVAMQPGNASSDNDWLLGIIDIGADAGSPDDPPDVSANKHKYLAEAHYAELNQPPDK